MFLIYALVLILNMPNLNAAASEKTAQNWLDDLVSGYDLKSQSLELTPVQWGEIKERAIAQFHSEYPAGTILATPDEFWTLQMRRDQKTNIEAGKLVELTEFWFLQDVYKAFYDNQIKPFEEEQAPVSKWLDSSDLVQGHWRQLSADYGSIPAGSPKEDYIHLLPESVQHLADNTEALERAKFMLYSAPVVASQGWVALSEAEKIKRYKEYCKICHWDSFFSIRELEEQN